MYILDLILFLAVIITIFINVIYMGKFHKFNKNKFINREKFNGMNKNKYVNMINFLPIILSIIHFILCKFNYLSVPVYMAAVIIFFMNVIKRNKFVHLIMCGLTIIILLIPIGINICYDLKNYGSTSYSYAFENLNNQLKENYPFTKWKHIDFNEKYKQYIDRFKEADKNNDKEEYYIALKDYLVSFNDGHITAMKPLQLLGFNDDYVSSLKEKYIGFGYGFSLIELDDGSVVVSLIQEDSEAFKLGIRVGTVITKWNDKSIGEAAKETSKLWSLERSADEEDMKQNNYMMLSRTMEGQSVNITFINEDNKEQGITLKAEKNNYNIGTKDRDIFYHKESNNDFEYKIINKNHGYIKLRTMKPENQNEVIEKIKNALYEFSENNVKDLIIDIRNNKGGDDEFGAKIIGLFSKEKTFYLQENSYDSKIQEFVKKKDMLCESDYQGFDKKIVVLVNSVSISAAEGFAYNIKKLQNGICAGITGTNGSFGTITNGGILMPENYIVFYPKLACLDKEGNIMIDSDYTGTGGVKPNLKIPFNMNAVKELYVNGKDYELDYILNYLDNE